MSRRKAKSDRRGSLLLIRALIVLAVGAALVTALGYFIGTGWVRLVVVLVAGGIGFLTWRRFRDAQDRKRLESERVEAILAHRGEWGEEICQYLIEGQHALDERVTGIMAHLSQWGQGTCLALLQQEISPGMTLEMVRLSLGKATTAGKSARTGRRAGRQSHSVDDAHESSVDKVESIENRVWAKISKMWPSEDAQEILDLLNECVGEGCERVHLAILKLSDGQTERLPHLIKDARRDWRDVLIAAESPEAVRRIYEWNEMSPEERDASIERDRRQYEEWLKS